MKHLSISQKILNKINLKIVLKTRDTRTNTKDNDNVLVRKHLHILDLSLVNIRAINAIKRRCEQSVSKTKL